MARKRSNDLETRTIHRAGVLRLGFLPPPELAEASPDPVVEAPRQRGGGA